MILYILCVLVGSYIGWLWLPKLWTKVNIWHKKRTARRMVIRQIDQYEKLIGELVDKINECRKTADDAIGAYDEVGIKDMFVRTSRIVRNSMSIGVELRMAKKIAERRKEELEMVLQKLNSL